MHHSDEKLIVTFFCVVGSIFVQQAPCESGSSLPTVDIMSAVDWSSSSPLDSAECRPDRANYVPYMSRLAGLATLMFSLVL